MAAIPCVVCAHPALDTINQWLAENVSAREIEDRVRRDRAWANIKRETIGRHSSHLRKAALAELSPEDLVAVERARAIEVTAGAKKAITTGTLPNARRDFALAVRDEALTLLERGDMEIDAKAGLFAQSLLDRRAEKDKDRDFMMNLARLLSGAGQGAPVAIIDGDYEVVEPEPSLLAPPSMRE